MKTCTICGAKVPLLRPHKINKHGYLISTTTNPQPDDRIIIQLIDMGKTYEEIGLYNNISKQRVGQIAKRNGISFIRASGKFGGWVRNT